RAYDGARSILRAERLRRERCPAIGTFIEGMVEDLRRETEGA
ncbi:MAG: guanylate kinase, partial [Alphaproteobacteria bacterium]|nr:guanylate kinase [Alphaproteobacteria bacterium]